MYPSFIRCLRPTDRAGGCGAVRGPEGDAIGGFGSWDSIRFDSGRFDSTRVGRCSRCHRPDVSLRHIIPLQQRRCARQHRRTFNPRPQTQTPEAAADGRTANRRTDRQTNGGLPAVKNGGTKVRRGAGSRSLGLLLLLHLPPPH